ncbi:hypothetical protein [Tenacibaculum caenipelagi]|uniref:Uncharacterized protein n=1 Tax=Tenacibaculum caenipelagi TaxID=1325435 RepID=A0A4R6TF21_9FLAO|nr:hypothetical protein [Tenacibaculum caenipelagi]TDQ25726.1 hypothetical protein DFQ07_2156 [Tenacibaculum caenipelagi]
MNISKSYLTILTNFILAVLGSFLAFQTDILLFVPMIFAIGIPIINLEKPIEQKIGKTLIIILLSTLIFFLSIILVISFESDKYMYPSLIYGLAGIMIIGINGLLVKSINLNLKTILLTFLLSSISFPIWILGIENISFVNLKNIPFIREFGVMILWMTLTTIGVVCGIKKPVGKNV